MRRDFRVKMDFSRIYQDARQHSWVYIDCTKILYVSQLAEHVQKLFDIKKPFHLLSRYDDMQFFLPFEEDVRVLENNDTVLIVPGTGITGNSEVKNDVESSHQIQNGFVVPALLKGRESNASSEKSSYISEKSSVQSSLQNTIENTSATVSFTGSLYRTALHETAIDDSKDSKMTEDLTEDNSIIEESTVSNKRKRIRKRRQKKLTEIVPESDASIMETSGNKPKIIDSILISSGKHIRFQGLDDEDTASDNNAPSENNIQRVMQNGEMKNNQFVNKDLSALLNLRQSSTPLTFAHKRMKRDYKPETINETGMSVDTSETVNKTNTNISSSKSLVEPEKTKENSQLNKTAVDDDTVSFKVFRIGDDYTPQLSNVILAKVLFYNTEESQYTLKILHGQEQLQDPEGKFSLPKDEEDESVKGNDIVVLEKSKLLELTKVTAIGTPS